MFSMLCGFFICLREEENEEREGEIIFECGEGAGEGHFAGGFGFACKSGDFLVGEFVPDAHHDNVFGVGWEF